MAPVGRLQPSVMDRRQLLRRCGCAALAGWGAAWARDAEGAGDPAEAPPMVPREVAPGCWVVEGLSAMGSPANRNFISNAWKFYCHYKWSAIYHKQKPDTAGTAANDWALQTPIIASGIFEFSPATGHGIAL